jgi:DNA-binding transcriptional LysR family regulator
MYDGLHPHQADIMDRLDAFEMFVRVVETGSFTTAARQLGVSQPTVSKTMSQLEAWLGVKLLLRSTRAVTLTEAGRSFHARARQAVEEAGEAVLVARGTASGLSGKLRVSAAVCFARLHIVPKLPGFLREHPELDLELALDDRTIDLVEEGIDLALRMGELASSNMTARKLAEAPRMVVATPAYLRTHGVPATPADLAAHDALIYSRERDVEWLFRKRDESDETVAVRLRGKLSISATEGLRAAVLADMGLAIASGWTFSPELATGEVVPVLTDWVLPRLSVSAVYPSGRLASTKARQFATFVERCLADLRFPD